MLSKPRATCARARQLDLAIMPVELVIAADVDDRLGIEALRCDPAHAVGHALAQIARNHDDIMRRPRPRQADGKRRVHIEMQVGKNPAAHGIG